HLQKFILDDPSSDSTKKKMRDEFIDRLLPAIKFYTKQADITSFDQALDKAETIELLLAEAHEDESQDIPTLNNNRRPMCDYCNKVGHIFLDCWYRPSTSSRQSGNFTRSSSVSSPMNHSRSRN
ncbi:hypothetical protein PMAYCL1PPCAC_28616, partial [Pristionchus mayeri]